MIPREGEAGQGGAGRKAFCAGADLGGGAAVFGDDADRPTTGFGRFPMQVLVYLRGMMHPRHVNELCQTGAMIDAARAREMGIANEVVPYEGLDAAVERTVARLCEMSPVALRRGKHVIAAMQSMDFAEALAFAEGQIALVARTDDAGGRCSRWQFQLPRDIGQ